MATYRVVVFDILETIKQTVDDAAILPIQVLWWVQMVANRLKYNRILQTKSGVHVSIYPKVTVLLDSTFDPPRQYIELPADIFELPNEGGVDYVSYYLTASGQCCVGPGFSEQTFFFAPVSEIRRMNMNPHEKPSADNPVAYRVQNRVYFTGTECIDIDYVEVGLKEPLTPGTVCDLDDPIGLSDDLMEELKFRVLKLAQFGFMLNKERGNDGDNALPAGIQMPSIPQQQQAPEPTGGEA